MAKGNRGAASTVFCILIIPGLVPGHATGDLRLPGGLVGLLILLRPASLAPVLFPILILISIDLQFGVEGLVRGIGVAYPSDADDVETFIKMLVAPA